MRNTIGDQLLGLKARSGLSLSEIARLAGYKGPSSLQRYFNPGYDPEALDYRTAQKLAEAMEGAGNPPIDQYEIMLLTAAKNPSGERPVFVPVQHDKETKGFVPIYLCEKIGILDIIASSDIPVDGLDIDLVDPVETLRCPPALERRDVFGFYMAGISMKPRFYPGETVFTDGRRPPSINDDVLLIFNKEPELTGHVSAVFGKLQEIQEKHFVITQYSGATFAVPLASINETRRVMHAEELLGGLA